MKAWMVGNDYSGYVFVRAETRGKARSMHPDYSRYDWETFTMHRAIRESRLDGPGPTRELRWMTKKCPCTNLNECGECWEGCLTDWDATIAANAGTK